MEGEGKKRKHGDQIVRYFPASERLHCNGNQRGRPLLSLLLNNLIVRWRAIIIRISLAASTATFNCYSATVRELFAPCFSQTRFRDRIKNIKISSPSFRFKSRESRSSILKFERTGEMKVFSRKVVFRKKIAF